MLLTPHSIASTVKSAPYQDPEVGLGVRMAQQVPKGISGIWSTSHANGFDRPANYQFNRTMPAPGDTQVSNEIWTGPARKLQENVAGLYFADSPLRNVVTGCPGSCRATVVAPALAVTSCTSYLLPVDYHQSIEGQDPTTSAPLDQVNSYIEWTCADTVNILLSITEPVRDCLYTRPTPQ